MCSCDDAISPDFYRERIARSRKMRRCFECRRRLQLGERYLSVTGKWDGDVKTHSVCLSCAALRLAYEHVGRVHDGESCSPAFGHLLGDARECFGVHNTGSSEPMRELVERKRHELLMLTGKIAMATITAGFPTCGYPYETGVDANGAPAMEPEWSYEERYQARWDSRGAQ